MRKPVFAYAKTNAQISCAVTAQLISAFVLATQEYNFSSTYTQTLKILAFFSGCTDWFVSDLVLNPKAGFLTLQLKNEMSISDLSLAVPITNSLTFIFTSISGRLLGEKMPSKSE